MIKTISILIGFVIGTVRGGGMGVENSTEQRTNH